MDKNLLRQLVKRHDKSVFSKFHEEIMAMEQDGENILDAINEWSERNKIDMELIAQVVEKDNLLMERLETAAGQRKLIKVDKHKRKPRKLNLS